MDDDYDNDGDGDVHNDNYDDDNDYDDNDDNGDDNDDIDEDSQLSMDMWQFCSSCGYRANFIEQERSRVNLRRYGHRVSRHGHDRHDDYHLLDHVEYLLCPVEPNVMVGDGHRLKGDPALGF